MTFYIVIFFYNFFGDNMIVYVDLLFLLNYYFDFLLLMTTSIVLKRKTSIKKLMLSALIGSSSIIFLFFNSSNIVIFIYKIIIAILMLIASFSYKDIKYTISNFLYFYMISIILGGFLYYLNVEFGYTNIGLMFISKKINVNVIFLLIISPIIFYLYIYQIKKIKSHYKLSYNVTIVLKNNEKYNLQGFLDTGNKLIDPITNKPIILIESDIINISDSSYYYVPFHSLNNNNLLKCIKPLYVLVDEKKFDSYLVGISDKKFALEGVECILNNKLMEELIWLKN